MTYEKVLTIDLGSGETGLTLSAQLINSSGGNTGSVITTGFTEIGIGWYQWYNEFDDEFYGGVKIFSGATFKKLYSINPEATTEAFQDSIKNTIIGSATLKEALMLSSSVLAGDTSGSGTGTITFKSIGNNAITRVVGNIDVSGSRTTTVYLP